MKSSPSDWKRKLLIIIPVAIGIGVFMLMVKGKTPPPKNEAREVVHTVRMVEAQSLDVIPTIMVHGTAEPERTWDAISEVSGRVIEINSRLREGNILRKGSTLLRIDPVDYELSLAQLSAELTEIGIRDKNTRASLVIEERNVKLAQEDLERKQALRIEGVTAQATVDQSEQSVLSKQASIQNLRNTLSIIPAERDVLRAKIVQAQRDLDQTVIRAPFDIRVADLNIENNQYVTLGQTLFIGDAIDRVEIVAQVPLNLMPSLLMGKNGTENSNDSLLNSMADATGLGATVQMELGSHVIQWAARVVRFLDTIDTKTRTVGIIVAVDNPYKDIQPGVRPPLVKGMFVQIIFRGAAIKNSVVIPRTAVRQGRVYVINAENRLESRMVNVLFSQNGASIVGGGLKAGERIVVSDLIPAVEGMALKTEHDVQLSQFTKDAALANGAQQ